MSKINQINLNTFFTNSKSEPLFYFNDPLFNITHLKISEVVMPNSFYTFDSRNNKISFKEGTGTETIITITPGNYTASSLITHLKTLFEANSENTRTYTLTYNSAQATITFAVSAGTLTFLPTTNNAYYELGLDNLLNTSATSITSGIIDLSGVKTINVVSSSFGNNISRMIHSNYNVLCSIPVNVSFLGILFYQNSNEMIDVELDNLYNCNFVLMDERLRKLTMTKDFQMSLLLKTI